jgi:hypothetical protein
MQKIRSLDSQTLEKINSSITNKKPTYLTALLVDILREHRWKSDDIHFLGVEIINESDLL